MKSFIYFLFRVYVHFCILEELSICTKFLLCTEKKLSKMFPKLRINSHSVLYLLKCLTIFIMCASLFSLIQVEKTLIYYC